ncbi:hypothetical protein QGN29_01310 [Temperatibacter marinus]|uniref:Uncharacterized protein n=1 Tax=Temperatibacter marinus TaxID=1456591 RepID=A0AA52ECP6_9PROT|nr:hypothetical protein [Temperatibacter marinus]WND03002.1 hypothetical protein QGN29_01310 [Temperatibacter marinus]
MNSKLLNFVRIIMALPALLFILIGLRWIIDPAGVAPEFGFELMTGLGLSSQIGDLSAYFLTLGLCAFLGIVTKKRFWFYMPVIMLGLTAFGRLMAWLIHHADFAGDMIMPEIIIALLWYYGSGYICETKRG